MNKVKVFRFEVSNVACDESFAKTIGELNYQKFYKRLCSVEDIERVINDFIKDKEVVSINVTPVVMLQHNNGGCDQVHLVYTIHYREA